MYCQVDGISIGQLLANIFVGFMRDSFLIGSLNNTSMYIMLMAHLLVLVHVMKLCCSSLV